MSTKPWALPFFGRDLNKLYATANANFDKKLKRTRDGVYHTSVASELKGIAIGQLFPLVACGLVAAVVWFCLPHASLFVKVAAEILPVYGVLRSASEMARICAFLMGFKTVSVDM
jgi:hypothetical protein